MKYLPDYASRITSQRPLQKVGIGDYKLFRLDFNDNRVLTRQSAYVNLISAQGIHMSRLADALSEYEMSPITLDDEILQDISTSHNDSDSYWECNWTCCHYVDDNQPVYFDSSLEGILTTTTSWYLTFTIPYASVCPCSAEMTKVLGGYPHMQRAKAKVTGQLVGNEDLGDFQTTVVSEIIDAVGLVPIPIMKRTDELKWCQKAAKYNLFVEDAARLIANKVDDWFKDWVVVCEHEESIHQHNVVAVCRKDGGTLL